MEGSYRTQRFRSRELYRLRAAEAPPAVGWALGADGLFRDGVRVAYHAEVQISGPDSVEIRYLPLRPEWRHPPVGHGSAGIDWPRKS